MGSLKHGRFGFFYIPSQLVTSCHGRGLLDVKRCSRIVSAHCNSNWKELALTDVNAEKGHSSPLRTYYEPLFRLCQAALTELMLGFTRVRRSVASNVKAASYK